ncbi:DivIVA domain-containing protein [Janibacter hoylei]|uniref:DivIVA domain-containing protein n=1 Tax=Janibacter hoylei TaxID=364298 RepID=UPI002491093E|nr:DivIVA domain-containing protein [Janibacter hoylei]
MSTGARPSFTRTRWREGYAVPDVDDFLDRVFHALSTGHPVPHIDGARFRPTRFGEGYDMEEVDDFLDELSAGLPDQ